MKKTASIALASGILALAATTAVSAAPRVERSGRTFHIAACGYAVAPGMTRCHVHLVTDSNGNVHPEIVPNHGPFSCAYPQHAVPPTCIIPSQLRAAYNITGTGGPGTTVAIVDAFAYPNAEADLAAFRTQFGFPPAPRPTVA
jgi:hypothetical protein